MKPESPFDSRPRIARTPIHSRRLSAENPLQLHRTTPLPSKFSDLDNSGLGVTGHGLLATQQGRVAENSSLANGVHNDDDKQSKTSGVGSSILGSEEDMLGIERVEVVGQGLLRLGKQYDTTLSEKNQLQYETEESDDNVEDDSDDDEEEEEEETDNEEEEEEEERRRRRGGGGKRGR